MARDKKMFNLLEACAHLDLAMWVAKYQVCSGNYFGFEHPAGSLCWDRDSDTYLIIHYFSLFLFEFFCVCSFLQSIPQCLIIWPR